MSYQTHNLQEFIPNYQVKSDFLPTRVADGNQAQTAEWVRLFLYVVEKIRRGKKKRKGVHPKTSRIQPPKIRLIQNLRGCQG